MFCTEALSLQMLVSPPPPGISSSTLALSALRAQSRVLSPQDSQVRLRQAPGRYSPVLGTIVRFRGGSGYIALYIVPLHHLITPCRYTYHQCGVTFGWYHAIARRFTYLPLCLPASQYFHWHCLAFHTHSLVPCTVSVLVCMLVLAFIDAEVYERMAWEDGMSCWCRWGVVLGLFCCHVLPRFSYLIGCKSCGSFSCQPVCRLVLDKLSLYEFRRYRNHRRRIIIGLKRNLRPT